MIGALVSAVVLGLGQDPGYEVFRDSVQVGGRGVAVSGVVVDPRRLRLVVGMGKGTLGSLDSLAGMRRRAGAVVAMNGAFFDAYSGRARRNTVQTLISGGRPVNLSDIGSVFGVSETGEARIERLRIRIRGTVGGQRWVVYRVNNDPLGSNVAMEFNRAWGSETGVSGLQAQVRGGVVTAVGRGSTAIPVDGYVLFFKGSEERMGDRFEVGASVTREVVFESGEAGFWGGVQEAVGGGPTLVRGGKVVLDAVGEGFRDAKILSGSGARSLVGIRGDGKVVLAVSSGTMRTMAEVMKGLGCREAMNMDGGASSGLMAGGTILRREGRTLSNALLWVPR